MRTVFLVGEDGGWLLERSQRILGETKGNIQLPYYTPRTSDIEKFQRQLNDNKKQHEVDFELFPIRTKSDIANLIDRIGKDSAFYFLCDGFSPFVGTPLSEMFKSLGALVFGSAASASSLSQDKFLQYVTLKELGIGTPTTWLPHAFKESGDSSQRFFVKPRSLGNSIGIFDDAVGCAFDEAISISERIQNTYGVPAIIQQYVSGAYVRASFMGVANRTPTVETMGIYAMEAGSPDRRKFEGFESYFAAYKVDDSTYNTRAECIKLSDLCTKRGNVGLAITREVERALGGLIDNIALRDFFSVDLIIDTDHVYVLEINTNPFIRNRSLDFYCQDKFGKNKYAAMSASISRMFDE